MKILVTGAAGFIGYHVCQQLLAQGEEVLGLDVVNAYYDPRLKEARLRMLGEHEGFEFERMDLSDHQAVLELRNRGVGPIIHLAAQAGVRFSIEEPLAYLDSNLAAWLHILELARAIKSPHLVMASSSSVYGSVETLPFRSNRSVDHPLSLYAATKRSGELLAHSYAHLYGIPTTCLRFFTVYGPWGRPDMALWKFVDSILNQRPIDLFNEGRHRRDFTYVDDVVDGVIKVLHAPAKPSETFDRKSPDSDVSDAPFRIYNLGNDVCVDLGRFLQVIEESLGMKAECNLLPRQPGDVEASLADIAPMIRDHGWRPRVRIEDGIPRFITWFEQWRRENPD